MTVAWGSSRASARGACCTVDISAFPELERLFCLQGQPRPTRTCLSNSRELLYVLLPQGCLWGSQLFTKTSLVERGVLILGLEFTVNSCGENDTSPQEWCSLHCACPVLRVCRGLWDKAKLRDRHSQEKAEEEDTHTLCGKQGGPGRAILGHLSGLLI